MDAFKLIPVSLAGWMNRRQQHVIESTQEEILVLVAPGGWSPSDQGKVPEPDDPDR